MTWIVLDPTRLQADISMRHRLLMLRYDVTLNRLLLLLLGVRGVVVSRAPARVQLHVKLFLFASHLIVLGLLGASESVPLYTAQNYRHALNHYYKHTVRIPSILSNVKQPIRSSQSSKGRPSPGLKSGMNNAFS